MNRRSFLSWFGFAAVAAPVAGKAVFAAAAPPADGVSLRKLTEYSVAFDQSIRDSDILYGPGAKLGTTIRIRLPNDYVINESAFLLDNRHNGSRTTARTIWLPDQSA